MQLKVRSYLRKNSTGITLLELQCHELKGTHIIHFFEINNQHYFCFLGKEVQTCIPFNKRFDLVSEVAAKLVSFPVADL